MRVNAPGVPLALLVLLAFVFSAASVWADNFTFFETPAAVNVTTTSASTSFTLSSAINAPDVKVCNAGNQIIYWACGASFVQATVPGAGSTSTPMGAGLCGVYHKGSGASTCAAITAANSSSATFTAGTGQ